MQRFLLEIHDLKSITFITAHVEIRIIHKYEIMIGNVVKFQLVSKYLKF